jgi:hypothetical protein
MTSQLQQLSNKQWTLQDRSDSNRLGITACQRYSNGGGRVAFPLARTPNQSLGSKSALQGATVKCKVEATPRPVFDASGTLGMGP